MSDTGEQKARTTQAFTLSGVPRVQGVAPETPQEDIRNALAIFGVSASWSGAHVVIDRSDYDAAIARLNLAVTKLERR